MNVENLVISHENVVFASGREVWVLEAVVRALVPAQDIVAAQATVLEAHGIVAAQAMAMVLGARLLVAGASLPRALEVSRLWCGAAEVPADHHHQDATVVDPQCSTGVLYLVGTAVVAGAEVLEGPTDLKYCGAICALEVLELVCQETVFSASAVCTFTPSQVLERMLRWACY